MLAAGSGRRYGGPKALADSGSGPWVLRALHTLADCDETLVVIGAQAERVAAVVPDGVRVLVNDQHADGMGSSLALGLRAVRRSSADAALVMLVDLPDVTKSIVDRLLHLARQAPRPAAALARASYDGSAGHPVLIGRNHFQAILAGAVGDAGARNYLSSHPVEYVECGDLGCGRDVDHRPPTDPPD